MEEKYGPETTLCNQLVKGEKDDPYVQMRFKDTLDFFVSEDELAEEEDVKTV